MSKKIMTHAGRLVGCDNRTRAGYSHLIALRETENFWVDIHGNKYRKLNGAAVNGDRFPMYELKIDTIHSVMIK